MDLARWKQLFAKEFDEQQLKHFKAERQLLQNDATNWPSHREKMKTLLAGKPLLWNNFDRLWAPESDLRQACESDRESGLNAMESLTHNAANDATMDNIGSEKQRIIREQHTRLVHLQRGHNKRVNGQRATERETNEVAVAMIAMSQQCCRTCFGSGSVQKTKKNIRYSVECKQCK